MLMLFCAGLTVFTRDQKHARNHAEHHRIAIFNADIRKGRIEIETFVGCFRFVAWPENAENDKCDKPKLKGVT